MRTPETTPYANWYKMHTSGKQGLTQCGVFIHIPVSPTIKAISSFGTNVANSGIGIINTISALPTVEGCTLWLGKLLDDGTYLWKVRTRARATATTTAVKVASFGDYDYDELDSIMALDEFLPHVKRGGYDGANLTTDFDVAYTAQGSTGLSPQAQFGCAKVCTTDIGYYFDGTRSKAWATGATITNYAWTFPNGTTSTASAVDKGSGWNYDGDETGSYVKLTVTDSNGNTHTTRRLIFGSRGDSAVSAGPVAYIDFMRNFSVTEITSEFGGGARAKLVYRSNYGDRSSNAVGIYNTIRDGAELVVYANLQHDSSNIIPPDNSGTKNAREESVLFNGYIVGSTITRNAETGEWSFEAATADIFLEAQYQKAMTLEDTASPAAWGELKDMTPARAAWYLIRYFSTLSDVRDVDIDQYNAQDINNVNLVKHFDVGGGGFMSQLRSIFDSTLTTVSFDTQGTCYIEQDLTLAEDVTTLTPDLPLESDYCHGDISYDRIATQPAAQIYLGGADYAAAVDSIAPDNEKGYGTTVTEIRAGIAATQAQLNTLARRKYKRDALRNSAGIGRIKIELGNMPFDVVPQSTISLKVNSVSRNRMGQNPGGFIQSPFSEQLTNVTPAVSPNGIYYFCLQHERGIMQDGGGFGSLILYHRNPYYNNANIVAIGKLVRCNGAVLIAGNNVGNDSFAPVNPAGYAAGNNQYTLLAYTGGVTGWGGTLDSLATIKTSLQNTHTISSIASTVAGLTYVYNTGDPYAPIKTATWDSNFGQVVDTWIVWAGTVPITLTADSGEVEFNKGEHFIRTAPRSLTWSFDHEKHDLRCRYELEPIDYKGFDLGTSGF